ncbi:partner of Y14 and mago-like [Trifolium pratense]|uniref:partner of Y14 and mago-like n=1 Tax=Trifolium pratense TaxID=57577 RepID=UPI001E697799|nr:partner of Y14 and mago-like [Trifolium pratense]
MSERERERERVMSSTDRGEDQVKKQNQQQQQGERILAPTRRPDGTYRKQVRIRAGYTPQDEVAIYQPKPALMRKEMASHIGPPGYDPQLDSKPKTKAVKRNERKKEKKRLQANESNLEPTVVEDSIKQEAVVSLTSQINELAVSGDTSIVTPTTNSVEASEPIGSAQDLDKRIRALKKKIRLTEALQEKTAEQDLKPEQLEKLAKLEDWRKELKQLEDNKAEISAA